jgi:hypothetical protein
MADGASGADINGGIALIFCDATFGYCRDTVNFSKAIVIGAGDHPSLPVPGVRLGRMMVTTVSPAIPHQKKAIS